MNIKIQLEEDIKKAMLSGDKFRVTTLRGLKSSILNVEVAEGAREAGLSNEKILAVFAKEAKKRQEAADLYKQAGSEEKAQNELDEKSIISEYLPKQMEESEVKQLVGELAKANDINSPQQMGQLIGLVKAKSQGTADGGVIARFAKEYLAK